MLYNFIIFHILPYPAKQYVIPPSLNTRSATTVCISVMQCLKLYPLSSVTGEHREIDSVIYFRFSSCKTLQREFVLVLE